MADLSDYEWLTSPDAAGLLADVANDNQPLHRQLSRLRRTLSAVRANLLVQQVELRNRAVAKFGDLAARMFFTDVSLQQATDLWTARYKASRVSREANIADYCCGIGGDLLALSERGPTTGWDRDPTAVHLANPNLRAVEGSETSRARVGEVESHLTRPDDVWHIDPDRRSDGRRSTQLQYLSPGPDVIERLLEKSPNGIVKLAPASDVPEAWTDVAELEWVTFNRECRQQIAWFGDLATARGQHRATVVSKNSIVDVDSFVGTPHLNAPLAEKIGRYICDTDPSIRAAALTGALAVELSLQTLDDGPSYLTSDQPTEHPLLSGFEVLDQLPLRVSTLSQHLRSLNVGQLEIKKRGVDTDPERLRKQLKLRGDERATLLLTRVNTSEIAVLARRLGD